MQNMRRINIRFKARDLNTSKKTKCYIEKKSGTVAREPLWLGNHGVGHEVGTVGRLAREVRDR